MGTQSNTPRPIARELLKDSVSNALWWENQPFINSCRERLQSHPMAEHSAIPALNHSNFGLDAVKKMHSDYRLAIGQIFIDDLLLAASKLQC
jgi:hypothetical protein